MSISGVDASCRSREHLTGQERGELWNVFSRHFPACERADFEQDLDAKSAVILLRTRSDLVGFSTFTYYRRAEARIVFSGDTIIDPAHWGSPALARCWLQAMDRWRQEAPTAPHYWFLICSGFRTYRFLPVFWRRFHPGVPGRDAPELAELLAALAVERFGSAFDHARGIITMPRAQVLREDLQVVPAQRHANEHVVLFLDRNPGHAMGDELACLVAIEPSNQTRAGQRIWTLQP